MRALSALPVYGKCGQVASVGKAGEIAPLLEGSQVGDQVTDFLGL